MLRAFVCVRRVTIHCFYIMREAVILFRNRFTNQAKPIIILRFLSAARTLAVPIRARRQTLITRLLCVPLKISAGVGAGNGRPNPLRAFPLEDISTSGLKRVRRYEIDRGEEHEGEHALPASVVYGFP